VHNKVPATSVAAEVWASAFRANFVPFWTHAAAKGLRAYRLDRAQYEAMHGLNAATRLTLLLDDAERMAVHRMALATPSAGLLTLEEVAHLLGVHGLRGSSCNGGSKGPLDAVDSMRVCSARDTARVLVFCRAAAISESAPAPARSPLPRALLPFRFLTRAGACFWHV